MPRGTFWAPNNTGYICFSRHSGSKSSQSTFDRGSPVDSMSDCHPDGQGSNPSGGNINFVKLSLLSQSVCDREINSDGKQQVVHSPLHLHIILSVSVRLHVPRK